MKRSSFLALAVLAVVLALAMPHANALIDDGELVALKAIRDAFPSLATVSSFYPYMAWSDQNLAAACQSNNAQPNGITCTTYSGIYRFDGLYVLPSPLLHDDCTLLSAFRGFSALRGGDVVR